MWVGIHSTNTDGLGDMMPIYDYKCNECGGTQEVERSFGDNTEPICCQTVMARVWSAPAVKFNGTGFYSTGG
jgi:putative FmdB family regulatory protein